MQGSCSQWGGGGQRSEQLDILQRDVSHHLQLGDAAQVLDPVFVVQLVEPVNGHSELLRVTQDDHLEVLSRSEGEAALQLRLLGAPAARQEGVSDEDAFLQTWVQMKSDVAAAGHSQVHTETRCVLIGLSFDGDVASVAQTFNQLTSEGNTHVA